MGLIDKIKGTSLLLFRLGLGATAINIKNAAGVLEARNKADSAYIIGRGLDPVGANDWVTKGYGDINYSASPCIIVTFAFGDAAGTVDSTATIPIGAYVHRTQVIITTAFDVDVTIDVGDDVTAAKWQPASANDSAEIDDYECRQAVEQDEASAKAVRVTLGAGAPGAGAGFAIVYFCTPAV